jgi:YgbB-like protein
MACADRTNDASSVSRRRRWFDPLPFSCKSHPTHTDASDFHAFAEGRTLTLAGITFETFPKGPNTRRSDGDVVAHAIVMALADDKRGQIRLPVACFLIDFRLLVVIQLFYGGRKEKTA